MKPSHIILEKGTFICLNCGSFKALELPMKAEIFIEESDSFHDKHWKCKEQEILEKVPDPLDKSKRKLPLIVV